MWNVPPPGHDTGETFNTCARIIRNPIRRQSMLGARDRVIVECNAYEVSAASGDLHKVSKISSLGAVSGAMLEQNYTDRMVKKTVPGRVIYDQIKLLPRNNVCPFCNYGRVETLDHFLPKNHYPVFSVHPRNLVGCCDRCNRLKGQIIPTRKEDVFVHPYFDIVDDVVWLKAHVVMSKPPVVTFCVDDSALSDRETAKRISCQFEQLVLGDLYSDAAAVELSAVEYEVEYIFDAGGANAVSEYFVYRAHSRRRYVKNSWQAAMFEALSKSTAYCNGGFRLS